MPEIIATGVNNAFLNAVIAFLKLDSVQGHTPTSDDYVVSGFKPAEHHQYIKIPRTIIRQNYSSANRYNFGERIAILSECQFNVTIADGQVSLSEDGDFPSIVTTINNQFLPVRIGTDDQYYITARQLYGKSEIPFVPRFDYFEAFKDSLLYWDAESEDFEKLD
ncbi:hypothetical protein [Rhodohalobacter sp. 8-1]|uniref:hypothetical protein n=1 Tax=Rhodohalobacter sp. 8-1 TaxID=3131972 RepID=UPI0030EBBE45